MRLPYTLCFCTAADSVLMLRRNRPPNAGKWNGLGGKIEGSETPLGCAEREVMEEAGLDVSGELRYGGVVTWNAGVDPTSDSLGMHVFTTELPGGGISLSGRETGEGPLAWKTLEWACDRDNERVVSNIPRFLPTMLFSDSPKEFRCEYEDGRLASVATRPI